MNISIDEKRFADHQKIFLEYMANSIKETLEGKGVDRDSLPDITGDLLFSICSIIDSSAVVGTVDNPVLPMLTFSNSLEQKNVLFASESGSSLHEMVFSSVEELYR